VAYQHVRENPVLPSGRQDDIPRAVDSIVMKSLAKNTANRYQSAGDMRQDIQRALANQPVVAEAVMTDAERTQFIARTPPPPVAVPRRSDVYADEPDNTRRNGLIWLAVVLAMLLVIGGASWLILKYGDEGGTDNVTVPAQVIGMSPTAAERTLSDLKLNPVKGEDTHGPCQDNQPGKEDFVCTLTPAPGAEVKEGDTVTYHLYTPGVTQVPNVVDKNLSAAEDEITKAGLKYKIKRVDDGGTRNQVVDQSPDGYQTVAPGSTVTLKVSTGKKKLPKVVGMSFDDARATLNTEGFTNVVVPPPTTPTTDESKDGKVADQSPTGGIAYPLDTQITLTVYEFKAPPSSSPPSSSSSTTGPPTGGPTH
jgi:serine/threonine-protein kinase